MKISVRKRKAVKPIPAGYHTVTSYLACGDGAAAIEFYKKAFGAKEKVRMPGPDGKVGHAEIEIGDSRIMLTGEYAAIATRSPRARSRRAPSCCARWKTSSTATAWARCRKRAAKAMQPAG